ncbi:helix-turn-helix domain-containing protein [Glycomyces sp. TRM65418]|uniref:helix-turn-helix domain-containing protein n=1 Tax=Glycomyces sp. TRM65418 TaxID=2867006 RepID=UPI001CE61805|nr:helix-turn-helix domain-containing protein [Glycomyces sp. TRM65418]MCC3762172.1 helix-turn-helix domain-containing protein [Glycomyces sp. TRM65418]QZD56234.1 helix-turn-helix domain-containing protein [Glycomyces sp. TRM65418]
MLVNTRQDDIMGRLFETAGEPFDGRGSIGGLEILTLARLRASAAAPALPFRSDRHCLLTLTSGSMQHAVDFTSHSLGPGQWLWTRPGQVQQWGGLEGAEGTVIRFSGGFLDSDTAIGVCVDDPHAPVLRTPASEDHALLRAATTQLQWEYSADRLAPETRFEVLRHLLAVLVLRLASLPGAEGAGEPSEVYLAFRDAVERDFANTRRLSDYAKALAYSPRTLSRATLAAAGMPAKEFIDRRVILEAKRMLACSAAPAARIGEQLGFTSATNFNKFFTQRTGTTPIAFRTEVAAPRDV